MKIIKNNKKEAMMISIASVVYYEFIFIYLIHLLYSLILNLFILIKFSFLRNTKFFFRDDELDEVILN